MLDGMLTTLAGFISGVPRLAGEQRPASGADDDPGVPAAERGKPWTEAQERGLWARPNSFTNLLPWREYDAINKCFVLENSTSVGAYFELTPIGCEARPDQWMRNLRDNFQNVLRAIPEVDDGYWMLQVYLNDEPSLDGLMDSIREYVHPRARNSAFTNDYLARMEEHLKSITRPGGLFVDTATSGAPWRGQMRRVRAVLYRRRGPGRQRTDMTPIMELNDAATRFENALASAGVGVKRCGGRELYRWMLAWFNPRTPIDDLLAMAPYPGDHQGDEQPHGNDFAEALLFSRPRSDREEGIWWFDGLPHRTVSVQELRAAPHIGHITAERTMGDYSYAMFDRIPEGATLSLSITIRPREKTLENIEGVYRKSKGDAADAEMAREECEAARRNIANGNVLYPVEMVWYLRGRDTKDLRHQVGLLKAMLLTNNLQVIDELGDKISTDTYIRNLPMKYDPSLDVSSWTRRRRSRSWYIKHIANMLPLYSRSTGTGHPGFVAFSRSAEPLTFDPLNKRDRAKNAFMLMLGPPGSGKSATAIKMLMHYMAMLRPRLFIIEAGNSFGLFGDHCRKHGLTVNHVRLMPGADVSLPPFSEALRLLDKGIPDPGVGLDDDENKEAPGEVDAEVAKRDYLGEMEIAARLMITGGEKKEDDRMTRADRMGIRRAIVEAARAVDEDGRQCVLVTDVVLAMRRVAEQEKGGRPERLREMADGMEMFCSGLAGEFFNREGARWPDSDVTIVDMGILAREGYEDQLAVAVVGLMNAINNLAERDQHDERPTIVPIDEAHIITTNPLLAPFVVKMAKMWRKLGCWLWLITQNLADFPDASRKMLNMLEWWICLVMPKDEVEQIARFRSLTDEQRSLLLAPRKEPGKYTEGVVMSDKVQALFRVVSMPIALALAQTEKHEKAERAGIMAERGCTELEAVYVIAERIGKSR